MPSSSVEDGVTTSEFYYLLLVIGAFASFAAGMVMATLQYQAWRRQAAGRPGEVSLALAPVAVTRKPVARAA